MNLEQVKNDKVKEAEELFLKLGIDDNKIQKEYTYLSDFLTSLPTFNKEVHENKNKLIWTRLSINSNIGCIIE
jgi:hypothetical protein